MTHPAEELARACLAALIHSGVRDIVYCPGSRCAPLAYALDAACRAGLVRAHVRLDERSAGFLALGLSRAGRAQEDDPLASPSSGSAPRPAPVAIITTSGGAVAELHAAVAEARHSRLPLIVLSADRPAELQGVGASQTTEQPGIFSSHALGVLDLPADTRPEQGLGARIRRIVARGEGLPTGTPGPVQINIAFREPLTPEGGSSSAPHFVLGPAPARVLDAPEPRVDWGLVVEEGLRTLILAGDGADPDASDWAARAALPILAEPSSGLAWDENAIPFQQSLLSGPLARRVEQVIVTGRPTLSRPVSALLARRGIRIIVVDPSPEWVDAAGAASIIAPGLAAPRGSGPSAAQLAWMRQWREASARAGSRITRLIDEAPLSILGIARTVMAEDRRTLLLGASNSVRAVDLVGRAGCERLVVSNRGLAGIDGTLATGVGLALGRGEAVTVLLGDLAFCHDAGALAIPADEATPDLLVIVADDSGGGIFAGLEHGRPENAPTFDRWFATAQPTSIRDLAAAYGADYREAGSEAELSALIREERPGIRILRAPCSRPRALAAIRAAHSPEGEDPGERRA